eukprot:scaffold7693_cov152-Ochromonas_danica.AAC.2
MLLKGRTREVLQGVRVECECDEEKRSEQEEESEYCSPGQQKSGSVWPQSIKNRIRYFYV